MLIRWTPWQTKAHLDRVFHTWNADQTTAPAWQPLVDIYEDAERYQLLVDLPGMKQDDVSISIEKNQLGIRGERRDPEGTATHRERPRGVFERLFTLPPLVDCERVTAAMDAGVLTVTLPKKAEAKARQIPVNVVS